jgi:large subunit ribosomal protein L35
MPKMKSSRSAAKRFKVTGSGKIKHGKGYRRHILTSKTQRRKRHLRKAGYVAKCDETKIRRLLGY